MATSTINDDTITRLIKARTAMLLQQPFWGTLAMRLKFKDATDDGWLPTMAVDGVNMYYNREFVQKLSQDELVFLIAHETSHVVYGHVLASRIGSRDRLQWNQAIDHVVNLELVENGVGKFPNAETCGIQGCLDESFAGMYAEQVYEILESRQTSSADQCFDTHCEPIDADGKPLSEQELEIMKEEVRRAIIQAARAAGDKYTPPAIRAALHQMRSPRVQWREILRSQLKSLIKNDYTWTRQSKKSQSSGYWLPATTNQQTVKLAVAVDCSGSISSGALEDLITEVSGIMQEFDDFQLDVWCFDTAVYNHRTFTPHNAHELGQYEISGGGGTLFECNWTYMQDQDLRPEKFIMMTDGCNSTPSWGDSTWCDTIFLIHGDASRSLQSPFGLCIHYDKDDL